MRHKQNTPKTKLLVGSIAQPNMPYGYGIIGKHLIETLKEHPEIDVNSNGSLFDYSMIIGLPSYWILGKNERKDLFFHTMLEVFPLPEGWAEIINRTRGLWVPSNWVKDLFVNNGVKVPVIAGGYGIDTDIFVYRKKEKRETFKVGVWARNFVSRKNVLGSIKTFVNANLTNSVLDVKLNDELSLTPTGIKNHDNINIISENWSRVQVSNWLRDLDVLLYLSEGEGFGLMPLESMACGTPVICAYNTGMMDYLSEDYAYLVESTKIKPSFLYERHFNYKCWGFEPNIDHATELLKYTYSNRDELYEKGKKAAEFASKLTWEYQVDLAWQRIKEKIL